jgi:L-asparaginase / beta-aspartyl-peptidase
MKPVYAIAIHGGAGVNPGRDYRQVEVHFSDLITAAATRLEDGQTALDVVEWAIEQMEASGLYCAGRGAGPNTQGAYELDASIMDGTTMRAGGVCAIRDVQSPIKAARAVMDQTPHVLLAGAGGEAFCHAQGLAFIADPASYYRLPVGVEAADLAGDGQPGRAHGTVGAVAMDIEGRLAAGTSTGGTYGKLPGRVGDSPLPGIGTWADRTIALSCTGIGECFVLSGGAGDVAARMRYGGASVQAACDSMIEQVGALGGDGGVIAIDANGSIHFSFNSPGMKRASASSTQKPFVAIL